MNETQTGFVINQGDFRMQEWLLKAELSAGAKLTYSVLACCAGGRDHAWPSQDYLAAKVSVSLRTVQRYLAELVRFGLIEKCRQYIKGQVRNVYRFLLHSMISLFKERYTQDVVVNERKTQPTGPDSAYPDQHAKMPPCDSMLEKNSPTDTTICPERHAKMSPSLNKEETIKGKDTPPAPLTALPAAQRVPDRDVAGNAGEFFQEVEGKKAEWVKIQDRLKVFFTENEFQTWISPLIFENSDSGGILRCPNPFFLNWVKKHFSHRLEEALGGCGLETWTLDLFTEEQLEKSLQLQEKEYLEKSKVESVPAPTVDVDSLPLEEQFDTLYRTYPRSECRENGWKVFCRLHRANRLPKTSTLIRAVKRAKDENPSWQRESGRYSPQIHKWLLEKRWMD